MSRSSSSSSVSVYAGRTRLGSVQRRGDSYAAINTDGVVVGSYTTQHEAADALEEAVS